MKNLIILLSLCLLQINANAQTAEPYASVRISLIGKDMADLVRTGIETEHGAYYPGRSITVVLSTREIERVQNAGFQTEVLIADLTQHYLENRDKPAEVSARGGDCNDIDVLPDYETPVNYSYGTMGGYLTYDSMMAELDKMRALYPNLVSERKICSDTIVTWEGRPIYNVKISDNPDVDETEPAVLYTALHHAREPNSASQLIFYMWYLLEHYAERPDIQAIVNNLEMYFVPCVNVDGYIYNETNNPNGGGFWRKNRRDNGDGTFGVDLNRNYGYFWGDFGGSSPDTDSEIYRGPAEFSEPESRTMRDFCREHDFLFVYNYHTSGNLFIYPWAYNDSPADSAFIKYARHFTRENHYHFGTTTETVGYNVNGSSDDWMYGETGAYSFTPEVGTTGFWPSPNDIDALNKENLLQNLSMAYAALRYGEAIDWSPESILELNGDIQIEFTRYGLSDGPINVSLVPVSNNISSTSQTQSFDIANLSNVPTNFPFQLDGSIQDDDEILFLLKTDNGYWVKTDTLRKLFSDGPGSITVLALEDNLDNTANWATDWSLTDETFHSAATCLTDSPYSDYPPNDFKASQLLSNTSIPVEAISATLRFFAKWDIEANYDYVQVVGLGDNNFTKALCGLYTDAGVNSQVDGPVFDGTQGEWVEECMDVSDFIGQSLNVLFLFGSDGFVEGDGFFLDDLGIEYSLPEVSATQSISFSGFQLMQNEPNPSSDRTRIEWNSVNDLEETRANLLVFNILGAIVAEQSVNLATEKSVDIDTRNLAAGIYTYLLRNEKGQSEVMKMSVVH